MKKIIILIALCFLVSGCSLSEINHLDYSEIFDTVIKNDVKANTNLKGYKIYVPYGMSIYSTNDSNTILYSNGEKYYLYVDLISYYNKSDEEIKQDSTNYYQEIPYNDKVGYIKIEDNNGKSLLTVSYNYAKVEVLTSSLKEALTKSLVILKSVTYNDKVIESLIGSNTLDYSEETFVLEGPTEGVTNFLQYEEDYGNYEDTLGELPSENKIDINNN